MARYIDADKLIEGRVENDPVVIAANCEPAADVQEVSCGKQGIYTGTLYYCSTCGHLSNCEYYCSVCGAKIKGGKTMSELKINDFAKEVHENAVKHGWYDPEPRFGEVIALCHSELSEALQEYRNESGDFYQDCSLLHLFTDCTYDCYNCEHGIPSGVITELIDCVLRILDYAAFKGVDIEDIMRRKHEYNKTRPYRHGGKVI